MLCEYAYYKSDNRREKPCCNNKQKLLEDKYFGDRCPLIYYCPINERFENTDDMLKCVVKNGKCGL